VGSGQWTGGDGRWTVISEQWTANNGKSVGFVEKCKYFPIIVNEIGVIAQREMLMPGEGRE
jgi:hypothetical protein